MGLFRRVCSNLLALSVALIALFGVGCNDVSYEIGADYLPDGNKVDVQYFKLSDGENGVSLFSVSNYFVNDQSTTDGSASPVKINGAEMTTGVLGLQDDAVFGRRRSGFFSQYTPANSLDSEGFGVDPVGKTFTIYLTVSNFVGDTTVMQQFALYEVRNDDFLRNSADSVYRAENTRQMLIDGGAIDINEPIITFNYPDQAKGIYVGQNFSTISFSFDELSESGQKLMNRLMLNKVDGYDQISYTLYDTYYEYFLNYFHGVYLAPVEGATVTNGGAAYGVDIELTLFGFTCEGTKSDDTEPDTYGMTYALSDPRIEDYGCFTIASVERENGIEPGAVETPDEIRVEGMGGVSTLLTFEQPLFDKIYEKIQESEDDYSTAFINSAVLRLYVADGMDMNAMPSRLALYTNYTNLVDADGYYYTEAVEDYDFYTELWYGEATSLDGTLNRSHKCYEMNIELHLQEMWGKYLDAKESGATIVWEDQSWAKVIVAPAMSNLFTARYARLNSKDSTKTPTVLSPLPTEVDEPISLQITYTLVK